jgi:hypothetical protein
MFSASAVPDCPPRRDRDRDGRGGNRRSGAPVDEGRDFAPNRPKSFYAYCWLPETEGDVMHVRISTVTGESDIDGGLGFLRDQGVPQLQQQKGFRGPLPGVNSRSWQG